MATLQIPIRNDIPAYTEQVELEGNIYFLAFRFNSRKNRWIMDIFDETESPILYGLPLLIDNDLTGRFKDDRLPKGLFLLIDESGSQSQPDRYNFSNDVILLYIEEADVG